MSFAIGIRTKTDVDVTKAVGLPPYVLPIKSLEFNKLEEQLAFQDNYWQQNNGLKEGIINDIEDSFKKVKKVIEDNSLDFLKGINYFNIFSNEIKWCERIKIIEEIPIYLVSHYLSQNKDKEFLIINASGVVESRPIPQDEFMAVSYDWHEFEDKVEKEDYESISSKIHCGNILGLYQNDGNICNHTEITIKSRVFLWVDHINQQSMELGCDFKSIFVKVLFHELMHALMDIYHDNSHRRGKKYESFEYFKEESLANGLALYLCNEIHDVNITCESGLFALKQNIPYCIGWKYKNKEILKIAVENWMKIKRNGIDNNDIHEWFKTIAQGLYISNEKILQAEKKLSNNT